MQRVYEGLFLGRPAIIKQRFSKKYRHATLDSKLTQLRFKQEVRAILKARKLGILTPAVYFAEAESSTIYMERLDAKMVKDLLLPGALPQDDLVAMLREVGRVLALMHDGSLVHGDLTTSNLLVRNSDKAVAIIDFGLSQTSSIHEDKAVDLYVLERAVTSMAATNDSNDVFDQILASYRQHSKQWRTVLNKFSEVRMRGRKRAMIG